MKETKSTYVRGALHFPHSFQSFRFFSFLSNALNEVHFLLAPTDLGLDLELRGTYVRGTTVPSNALNTRRKVYKEHTHERLATRLPCTRNAIGRLKAFRPPKGLYAAPWDGETAFRPA